MKLFEKLYVLEANASPLRLVTNPVAGEMNAEICKRKTGNMHSGKAAICEYRFTEGRT